VPGRNQAFDAIVFGPRGAVLSDPNSDENQAVPAGLTAYVGALVLLVILGPSWG